MYARIKIGGRRQFARWGRLLAVAATSWMLAATSSVWGAVYNFAYDEVGRLTGVVDEAGNTATYAYDAAGNITAIGRGSAAVSVMGFSPRSGPAGTNVTISGAGFSATASQNTVQFNGVTATISSASSNQLVAQVPAGATTGPITVTSPSGSATSSTAFTVAQGAAPVISGFTPTIGTPGTAVTVNGSDFQTTINYNNLTFNTRPAMVSAATASTLTTTVPASATSGRLALTTPYGQAVSSQDFFVPPPPRTAADVAIASRMTIDSSQTVSLSTAGKIGLIIFDAAAGQRVRLSITSSTFGSCSYGSIQLLGIAGSPLASGNLCSGTPVDTAALPVSGTYTILLVPYSTATGSITFTLNGVPPDQLGTITVDGPTVTLTTTAAGQNGALTFSGSAGQRVALQAVSSTFPNTTPMGIYKPDAAGNASTSSGTLFDELYFGWSSGGWTDVLTLPATGTYTIFVNPRGADIGGMGFKLTSVPPDQDGGTITVDGPTVALTTTAAGQNGALTFSGSAGQRVALQAVSSTFPDTTPIGIYKPDAAGNASTSSGTLFDGLYFGWSSGGWTDVLTLPATGTYTIFVNPRRTDVGSMGFKLTSVPPDQVGGTITVDGPTVALTTTAAGQNGALTFSGSAGQRVALQAVSSTFPDTTPIGIYKPDAAGNASTSSGTLFDELYFGWSSGSWTGVLTLPATGTYTIFVNPRRTDVGSMSLVLQSK